MRTIRVGALAALLATAGLLGAQTKKSGSVWEDRKSAWLRIPPGDRDAVFRFGEEYKTYLKVARTTLTSTAEVLRLARAAGFSELTEASSVKPGARLFVNGRDRAVILILVGSEPIVSGSRTIGAHYDSPHIDLKARPVYTEKDADNFALFKTIYYGGSPPIARRARSWICGGLPASRRSRTCPTSRRSTPSTTRAPLPNFSIRPMPA
jgi:hypothetical protein